MIDCLIAGKLHSNPAQRTGKSGKPFTTAKLLASTSKGESLFVNVLAFSESAQAALMALTAGDAVSLSGSAEPTAWQDRDGEIRVGMSMIAANVLTAYSVTKKRKAMQRESNVSGDAPATPATPYGRPHDEAWRAMAPHDRSNQGDVDPLDF